MYTHFTFDYVDVVATVFWNYLLLCISSRQMTFCLASPVVVWN